MNYIYLDRTGSTNDWTAENSGRLESMTMVCAHTQCAGRGQRGNSWESAPGLNLTTTVYVEPRFEGEAALRPLPVRQFAVSEATALAVADALAFYGLTATLKWPNDIYVDNGKICGILIEHSVMGGEIRHSRLGIGVNVNQQVFTSDAPNPVSLATVTGRLFDLSEFTVRFAECLEKRFGALGSHHEEYLHSLYRREGEHPFILPAADGDRHFRASIADVLPDGTLMLRLPDGEVRPFLFKEVGFDIG